MKIFPSRFNPICLRVILLPFLLLLLAVSFYLGRESNNKNNNYLLREKETEINNCQNTISDLNYKIREIDTEGMTTFLNLGDCSDHYCLFNTASRNHLEGYAKLIGYYSPNLNSSTDNKKCESFIITGGNGWVEEYFKSLNAKSDNKKTAGNGGSVKAYFDFRFLSLARQNLLNNSGPNNIVEVEVIIPDFNESYPNGCIPGFKIINVNGPKIYTNEKMGFSLKLPAGWNVDTFRSDRSGMGMDVVFMPPYVGTETAESISVSPANGKTAQDHINEFKNNIHRKTGDIIIDGEDGKYIETGEWGITEVFVVHNGKLYSFGSQSMIEEKILDSFKFL